MKFWFAALLSLCTGLCAATVTEKESLADVEGSEPDLELDVEGDSVGVDDSRDEVQSRLQRLQLDTLKRHAPDIYNALRAAGWEHLDAIEKYRVLVPLLRNKWGAEDSSKTLSTLNIVEQGLLDLDDKVTAALALEIVEVGVKTLLNRFVLALLLDHSFDAAYERFNKVNHVFPKEIGDFFVCYKTSKTDRDSCFVRLESDFFSTEISSLREVVENPEESFELIRKWRGSYSARLWVAYDEKLNSCTTQLFRETTECNDSLIDSVMERHTQNAAGD